VGASYTLGRLAEAIGATLVGDPDRLVTGVAPLDKAGPEHVSFLVSSRYLRAAAESAAGAVMVGPGVEGLPQALLRVDSAEAALIPLLRLFHPEAPVRPGVHPAAIVAADARVDPSASVGAGAVVEAGAVIGPRSTVGALCFVGAGAVLGDDVVLHPRAVVSDGVSIGNRVVVHSGAVLGADGFATLSTAAPTARFPRWAGCASRTT
jgi:UDP-3-O-[3-hydroxymyristoyl] glucosamine N-acyltransferase